MAMDLEPSRNDGFQHIKVTRLEKVVLTLFAAAIVGIPSTLWWRQRDEAAEQAKTINAIDVRTQLLVQKSEDMKKTLDAVPTTLAAHSIQLADHEARIKSVEQDVDELRKLKGLR